jgi:hypothetical protein
LSSASGEPDHVEVLANMRDLLRDGRVSVASVTLARISDGRTRFMGYGIRTTGKPLSMQEERQADLIMATALAKALSEVVERLDSDICEESTLAELKGLAERAEAELGEAA